MKKCSYKNFTAIILLFAIGLFGCKKEYKTTTKINEDGSCERVIVAKIDSANINNIAFPFPKDKSWNIQYKKLENDTQKVFVAYKYFKEVNEINEELIKEERFRISIKFKKKFRWFFTYFNYNETYKSYNQFNRIPLNSFLNTSDYNLYLSGDTSQVLKEKLDSYLEENLFEEFYSQLSSELEKSPIKIIPNELLLNKKKELKDSLLAGNGETEVVLKTVEKIFNTGKNAILKPIIEKIMFGINSKIEKMSNYDGDYINEVLMPGIILSTNANAIEGNKVIWKFNESRFCYADKAISVESRIINMWAVYITIAVVTFLIILLVVPRFRKRNIN